MCSLCPFAAVSLCLCVSVSLSCGGSWPLRFGVLVPLCLCVVVLLLWFFVCVVLCPCGVLSLCGCRCALCVLWCFHLLAVCIAAILVEGPPIGGKSWVVQPFAFDFACALCLCVCVCLFGCHCVQCGLLMPPLQGAASRAQITKGKKLRPKATEHISTMVVGL